MKTGFCLETTYPVVNDRVVVCYVRPIIAAWNSAVCYRGFAIRNPEDACDIKMAKSVARKKAVRAMYKDMAKDIRSRLKEDKRRITNAENYLNFLNTKIDELTNEITDITR